MTCKTTETDRTIPNRENSRAAGGFEMIRYAVNKKGEKTINLQISDVLL